jgi:hypothetical protein
MSGCYAKTKAAFDTFREAYEIKEIPPERIANEDQIKQMTEADGLRVWQDGPGVHPV